MKCAWKHYKGGTYLINHIAEHTETGEKLIVYHNISYPEKIWARPLNMWEEKVWWLGKQHVRFTKTDIMGVE